MKDHVDEAEIVDEAEPIEDVVENEEPTTDDVEEAEDDATQETSEETVATDEEPEGDDEFVVSFGDEEEGQKQEQPVIQAVREKEKRERKRRIEAEERLKELQAKLDEVSPQKPAELGPKPTLAACDYDDAKFEAELIAFNERKTAIAQQEQAEKAKQEAVQKEFNAKLDTYNTGKSTLGVKDFDESEAVITDTLSATQQGVIVDVAQDAAKFVYALGKYPDKAEELAKITNPVQFAAAIARMESKMTVTGKKSKPAPEKRMATSTGASMSGANLKKKLNALQEKAAKSGDRTEVVAFKRKHNL